MNERCHNCNYTRYKLNQLVEQYEQLLKTKQEEIVCSHRIIGELENELRQAKTQLVACGLYAKEVEKNQQKFAMEQQDTIQYLKQREVKLLEQLRATEKQVFKLTINVEDNQETIREFDTKQKQNNGKEFTTPKKALLVSNSGNVTLNKERENSALMDRLFQQSTIRLPYSDCKDKLKLKVAEDQLQLMNIKYKMALLKTVEVATLR